MTEVPGSPSLDDYLARFAVPIEEGSDKVTSLADAVRQHVAPGSWVHVAYSDARPNAALFELVRAFHGQEPGLKLSTAGLVSAQHALVSTGIVDHVETSFAGENYPVPRPGPAFQRALSDEKVEVRNWSLWTLTARLIAGGLGVPYFPVNSLGGSSMAEEHRGVDYLELELPSGEHLQLVSALRPDVVLLQGVAADRFGNVAMSPPYGEALWGALASNQGVIACVERIVDTRTLVENNAYVTVPGHVVLAVCQVPFGSHPYGLYNSGFPGVAGYTEDEQFMGEVRRATRDPDDFQAWIDEWILGTGDHAGYLRRLGSDRLARLTGVASPDMWRHEVELDDVTGKWNDNEMLVIAAARQVQHLVARNGHEAILAGVGFANLAAWTAADALKRSGVDIELMAEIGMFGYRPRPGEPFIFSNRNLPTCKLLVDVMAVLGGFVAGPRTRALGVIGAGQIDGAGNTNSTYTTDGRFLVGSGGANDIMSAAHDVLVTVQHRSDRLVEEIPYVTCPGDKVTSIVTTEAVFERDGEGFRLVRLLPDAPEDAREAVEAVRAGCGFEFGVADELEREEPPTADELTMLRMFDPDRVFLR